MTAALSLLENSGATIRAVSKYYQTPAFPAGAGPDFVNAAAEICAPWSAEETLAQLHAVEQKAERIRGARWAQRTLDLDLLACGDLVKPDEQGFRHWLDLPLAQQMAVAPDQLILPHPRLHERAFVLVPLNDIAPDWKHPILGLSVAQMLKALSAQDRAGVRALV